MKLKSVLKKDSSYHVIGRKRILYQPYSKERGKYAHQSESKIFKQAH